MTSKFKGIGVALVTPFDRNLKVDYPALGRLLDYTASNGVDYYVVSGTTGESVTTTREEKAEILNFVKNNNPANLPIVYGHGGNNTMQLKEDLKKIDLEGVDALLSVSPYYNKPSQAGLISHFNSLADASPVPIILYNVPGRTASNIEADTTVELSRHNNIIGIKEASGKLEQCALIASNADPEFLLISGEDVLTPPIVSIGGIGVISVLANGIPKLFTQMVNHCLNADLQASQKLFYQILELNPLMYSESNPVGIKQVLKDFEICGNEVRPPLVSASAKLHEQIQTALRGLQRK